MDSTIYNTVIPVRWIWRFDLGAVVLVGEQTARFVKAAVKKGEEVEPTLTKPFKKVEDSVSGALGEVGTRLKGIAKPSAPRRARRRAVGAVRQGRSEKGR